MESHESAGTMIEVSGCVVCDGRIRQLKRALVAPFLSRRIWGRAAFCVALVECEECGFIFYNPRLDSEEEATLYSGYRSTEYQRMREDSEPWYTERFNEELASPDSYERRRQALSAILAPHLRGRQMRRILDYGGDRGDLAQGLVDGAEAFVYEVSGVVPSPGVASINDPAACRADLIINSNVLEHVSFPRKLVQEILGAAPPGGLMFLEVPHESPFQVMRLVRRVAQIGITVAVRPKLAGAFLSPAALYMMHEHVNFFTERSLAKLMSVCGGQVIAAGNYALRGVAGKTELVWCLAASKGPVS